MHLGRVAKSQSEPYLRSTTAHISSLYSVVGRTPGQEPCSPINYDAITSQSAQHLRKEKTSTGWVGLPSYKCARAGGEVERAEISHRPTGGNKLQRGIGGQLCFLAATQGWSWLLSNTIKQDSGGARQEGGWTPSQMSELAIQE